MNRYRQSTYLLFILLYFASCSSIYRSGANWQRFEFSAPKMGTYFHISCYATDSVKVAQVAEKAWQKVDELNDALSDYHPESELNKLSASSGSGEWVSVSKPLWEVLNLSKEASIQTDGAFDVTVGNYVKLWRRARMQGKLPSENRLIAARNSTGYQFIHLDSLTQSVMLEKPHMKLDVGGIAKGYTADVLLSFFKAHGLNSVLIDAGGDLVVGNPPPGQKSWQVSVQQRADSSVFEIALCNQAVATSGDLFQYLELDGKKYSHIVNPFTGLGLEKRVAATVISPTGAKSDYLASVLSIWAIEKTKKYAESTNNVQVYITEQKDSGLETIATGIFLKHLAPR